MPAEKLFEIAIGHPFRERFPELDIVPTQATLALAAGYGFGIRRDGDRLGVFRMLGPDGRQRAAVAGTATFRFDLTVRDGRFVDFTDPGPILGLADPVFTNAGIAPAERVTLRLDSAVTLASEPVVPATAQRASVLLAGQPAQGARVDQIRTSAPSGTVRVLSIDPTARRVEIDGPGVAMGVPITLVYPAQPRRIPGRLAGISVVLDQATIDRPGGGGPKFTFIVPLAERRMRWAYYLQTHLADPIGSFSIAVTGPAEGARGLAFGADSVRDLSAAADPADPFARGLIARDPGLRLIRFLSTTAIPCADAPVRGIELQAGATRLAASLPNPQPSRAVLLGAGTPAAETILTEHLRLAG